MQLLNIFLPVGALRSIIEAYRSEWVEALRATRTVGPAHGLTYYGGRKSDLGSMAKEEMENVWKGTLMDQIYVAASVQIQNSYIERSMSDMTELAKGFKSRNIMLFRNSWSRS